MRDSTGYNKWREKMFRHHKDKAVYKGEFS